MNQNETAKTVKTLIQKVCPHIDKVNFKSDSDLSFLDFDELTNSDAHDQQPKLVYTKIKYHPPFYNLTLYQPNVKQFKYLCNAISTKPLNIFTSSAEVAYDMVTKYPSELSAVIEKCYVYKRKDMYFHEHKGIKYWGARGVHNFIPTLYERRSKVVHKPCSHFEFRLTGKPMCEAFGLSVPSDFFHLDYEKFFVNNTCFYRMPSKHEIGQAIALEHDLTYSSRRGYEKCCDKIMMEHNPNVQELMCKVPSLKHILSERKIKRSNASFTRAMQDAILSKL